jgi:hypothetical protein
LAWEKSDFGYDELCSKIYLDPLWCVGTGAPPVASIAINCHGGREIGELSGNDDLLAVG